MKKFNLLPIFLLLTFFGCSQKQEKVEKNVTVEMTVQGDSTAEATVTITTDSAGNEVQEVKVIKGAPETVKTTVKELKN
jgi:hypothetical protein